MITEKSWKEFRDTGLLLFVNTFLHIFGWALVLEIENDEVHKVYPARVSFRGFDENAAEKAYIKVTNYMASSAAQLLEDVKEDGGLR